MIRLVHKEGLSAYSNQPLSSLMNWIFASMGLEILAGVGIPKTGDEAIKGHKGK